MKIVHVNLARGFRGGERQTVTLIQTLAQKYADLQQVLVCRDNSPMRDMLCDYPVQFVSAARQWQGHFAVGDVDLVHAHEAKAVHWAWLHHVLRRKPYLLTRRVNFPLKSRFFGRKTHGAAHCVVAVSAAVREMMLPFSQNVSVIADAYSRLPEKSQTVDFLKQQFADKFVVGHIGALVDSDKGQLDLLAAARQLKSRYPDCVFVFLGQGADEDLFKQQSADLDNVHWLGFQSDVGSYLAVMDLFVFPSRTEGLGSTLLDAMAYDVPVVASRVGGIPDIVKHEHNGLLFESGDIADLVRQIERMYCHKSFRQQCIEHAQAQLARFSPEYTAAQYYQIYQDIIAARVSS